MSLPIQLSKVTTNSVKGSTSTSLIESESRGWSSNFWRHRSDPDRWCTMMSFCVQRYRWHQTSISIWCRFCIPNWHVHTQFFHSSEKFKNSIRKNSKVHSGQLSNTTRDWSVTLSFPMRLQTNCLLISPPQMNERGWLLIWTWGKICHLLLTLGLSRRFRMLVISTLLILLSTCKRFTFKRKPQ